MIIELILLSLLIVAVIFTSLYFILEKLDSLNESIRLTARVVVSQDLGRVSVPTSPPVANPQLFHHPLAPPEVINPDRPHLQRIGKHSYIENHADTN